VLSFDSVVLLNFLQDILYYLIFYFVLSVFELVDRDQFEHLRNGGEVWEFESIFLARELLSGDAVLGGVGMSIAG
jgi:hypothetical protein